jgi:hypothetical protein
MHDEAPEIIIHMQDETLRALALSGFYLCALSGVRSADGAGRPAAWLQTRGYALRTHVRPPASWHAFTWARTPPLVEGVRVEPGFHVPARPGETLVAALPGGGEMREQGAPRAVSLLNTTAVQLTCGLACLVDGEMVPVYAAPLYGGCLQVIAPVPVVFLFVSMHPMPPGTLVSSSTGPGVLLRLDSGAGWELHFDINEGWSWGDGVQATRVQAQSDLVRLLVEYPAPDRPNAGVG